MTLPLPLIVSTAPGTADGASLCLRPWRKGSNSRSFCSSSSTVGADDTQFEQFQRSSSPRSHHRGFRFEESVSGEVEKSRLDSWISSRVKDVSRSRIQSSILAGLVTVNGKAANKVSHVIKAGDVVSYALCELHPLRAEAEDIPLDIVYEDAHILVVNKPAHMVVHPAPGNANGTLVNGILHHFKSTAVELPKNEIFLCAKSSAGGNEGSTGISSCHSCVDGIISGTTGSSLRPGIVHRLDKGTSGLIVVAKDEHSHANLYKQFKMRKVSKRYFSLTAGMPSRSSGDVTVPIARDPNNRTRMVAVPMPTSHSKARYAASRYKVIEVLAGGVLALVEWTLETGRTHQIRAHAKFLGVPLLGDDVYGGTRDMVLSLLRSRLLPSCHNRLYHLLPKFQRPCLHAISLGFKHPHTGEDMNFMSPPPADFTDILCQLRSIGSDQMSHS